MRVLVTGTIVASSLALGSTINIASTALPLSEPSPPPRATAACTTPTFGAGVPSVVGQSPRTPVTADFNGDGIADLATASGNSALVILGIAGGTLGPATTLPVGQSPSVVATADFNGDGHPDLAVGHNGAYMISVLLGDGAGGFQSTSVAIPMLTYSMAAGDFTGDAHDDIAIVSGDNPPFARVITLLAGDGAGGFAPPQYFSIPWVPLRLAAGDLNGDGRPDLVTAMANPGGVETLPGAVAVLLADASGGFTGAVNFAVGRYPSSVTIGDVSGDGRPDIVASNGMDKTVSVLLGDGSGGFAAQQVIGVGGRPSGVTIADANLDGFGDIAVANALTVPGPPLDTTMGVVQIIPSDGAGGFGSLATTFAGDDPLGPVAADFNNDGRADLAIADGVSSISNGQVGVLLNTCGEQADVSVQMSGSGDPVNPYRSAALTLTADVTNNGPAAVPVVLRLTLDAGFTFEELSVTQGGCRPATSRDQLVQTTVTCWLGVLPSTSPGNAARMSLRLMTQWPATHLSAARAFSGALDPSLSDNYAGVTTRVGFMGGTGLRLRYAPGDTQVTLGWNSGDGNYQTGYYVARYVGGTRTILPEGAPIAATATTFSDPAPVFGQLNCYILAVLGDRGAVVGSSNGLCVQPGSASGTAPSPFLIQDYGSSSSRPAAWLNWAGPGGQTGYVLVAQPLNGDPQRRFQLGPSKVSYSDIPPGGLATCYVLAPYNGTTELGRSDKFCLAPGTFDYDW